MELHVRQLESDIHVIELEGELDLYNSGELKTAVRDTFEQAPRGLILDFEKLSYIDSSGIGVLLYTFTQAKKESLSIWFVSVHGPVRKVIELTSLLGFLPIAESYDDALSMLH